MSLFKPAWFDKLDRKSSRWLAFIRKKYPRTAKVFGIVRSKRRPFFIIVHALLHIVGIIYSIEAVMQARTPQGATAWAISLNTIPSVAVPAWVIFGDEPEGYAIAREVGLEKVRPLADALLESLDEARVSEASNHPTMQILAEIGSLPTLQGNGAELLIDGEKTFASVFEAIDAAETSILVQFYIFRNDGLGTRFIDKLIAKAQEGVDVYFLVDNYGSSELTFVDFDRLREGGVRAAYFMDVTGDANRFQLNFRNHRKVVVVDGQTAFIGGNNVGDEYLGQHEYLTPWRDTHVKLTGPVATAAQIPFAEDWHWATGEILTDLPWDIEAAGETGEIEAVVLATGPADPIETCSMFFLTAINNATDRVWIASPYFVPDDQIVIALQLAAIRGVDVRVIMPEMFDSKLVEFSSYSYLEELDQTGVKMYRYKKDSGFLHQKVVLVDDDLSAIGTANFDNRSFRLNFEITAILHDEAFNREVAEMLENDLANSVQVDGNEYNEKNFFFRFAVHLARLLAPIQ